MRSSLSQELLKFSILKLNVSVIKRWNYQLKISDKYKLGIFILDSTFILFFTQVSDVIRVKDLL